MTKKPNDAEIRRHFGVANDVPIMRHSPTEEEIASKGFLEKMSECFGVKGWMWKDWKGRLLAIIFLPPAVAGPFNYWYPKIELAYEYSTPYIQAAGAAVDAFSSEFIAFIDNPSPFDKQCQDSERVILCPQPIYQGPSYADGLVYHNNIRLYRIISTPYAVNPLSSGSHLFNGRWHTKGSHVLYSATDMVQAVGELMASVPDNLQGRGTFSLIEMQASGTALSVLPERSAELFANPSDMAATQNIGDGWFSKRESLMLFVPSLLQPEKMNVILNQNHPDFANVEITNIRPLMG
ncbi:RES domain protein [Grimontia celer]|uniref:RES domain protein n=1 Tax=Grimontia celer TaxID=1796497 RepID=A0A128EYW8_9GAMM|nr:RES family NAD+ phosphorylase [Grimontia celer]CZF79384.1 RES domain protein [Grimontia celer]